MNAIEKQKQLTVQMEDVVAPHQEINSCLYRLWYGERYVIVKGKRFSTSITMIQRGLAYHFYGGGKTGKDTRAGVAGAGYKEQDGKGSFYFQFNSFIKANPGLEWRVEMILISDNGYNLLKKEQQELEAAINDKRCLNSNVEAYVPMYYKETKTYGGWIKKAHVMNFKKFLKQPIRSC